MVIRRRRQGRAGKTSAEAEPFGIESFERESFETAPFESEPVVMGAEEVEPLACAEPSPSQSRIPSTRPATSVTRPATSTRISLPVSVHGERPEDTASDVSDRWAGGTAPAPPAGNATAPVRPTGIP